MDVRTHFPLLLQRVFNTPLVVEPQKAEMIRLALETRLRRVDPGSLAVWDDGDDYTMPVSGRSRVERRGYDVFDNIALIPICGTLVQKLGTVRPWCGMLGYDSVRQNFVNALQDDEVDGVLLEVDSPGGEAAGCFDLCDMMLAARGTKPVRAIVSERMCSGAYALGCTADRIYSAGTGEAGSIGVCWMHVDWSKFNAEFGVDVTYLTYGARKADGNPDEPLSDAAAASIQKRIDMVGDRFVNTVARARKLDFDDVRGLEAGVFMGEDAIEVGIVDEIMPIDQVFAQFREDISTD